MKILFSFVLCGLIVSMPVWSGDMKVTPLFPVTYGAAFGESVAGSVEGSIETLQSNQRGERSAVAKPSLWVGIGLILLGSGILLLSGFGIDSLEGPTAVGVIGITLGFVLGTAGIVGGIAAMVSAF